MEIRMPDTVRDDCGRAQTSSKGEVRIAYLIPEFPGQTHIFLWRERKALEGIGVKTHLVSTRRPAQTLMAHDWAHEAERNTFYLTDAKLSDIPTVCRQSVKFGPKAWFNTIKAAMEDCPPRLWAYNFVLILFSVRLIIFMMEKHLTHIHLHTCRNGALIAALANRLAGITYSMTLHGDLSIYEGQQRVKWRNAAFGIAITRRLHDQVHLTLAPDVPNRSE